MEYNEFLKQVIDTGIAGAKADYISPKDKNRLGGSIAGFEACRDKTADELFEIHKEANEYAHKAYRELNTEKYWWFRCYQLEVQWVCNVVSAFRYLQDEPPIMSHQPTTNAMSRAITILTGKS